MKMNYTLTWYSADRKTKYQQDFDTIDEARKELAIHNSRGAVLSISKKEEL